MAITNTCKVYETIGRNPKSKKDIEASDGPINATMQPNAIIIFNLRRLCNKKYDLEDKIKLIDYLSELPIKDNRKTIIDTISTALSQRWFNDGDYFKRETIEQYISNAFVEYSETPEELIKYIAGDKFEAIKRKIEGRIEEERDYIRLKIEDELNKKPKSVDLDKIRKDYEEMVNNED